MAVFGSIYTFNIICHEIRYNNPQQINEFVYDNLLASP